MTTEEFVKQSGFNHAVKHVCVKHENYNLFEEKYTNKGKQCKLVHKKGETCDCKKETIRGVLSPCGNIFAKTKGRFE